MAKMRIDLTYTNFGYSADPTGSGLTSDGEFFLTYYEWPGYVVAKINKDGGFSSTFAPVLLGNLPGSVAAFEDNSLLLTGRFTEVNGVPMPLREFLKISPNGGFDSGFPGSLSGGWWPWTSVGTASNTVTVLASDGARETFRLQRIHSDGSNDDTFAHNTDVSWLHDNLVVLSDGRVLAAQSYWYTGDRPFVVVRADGTTDTGFAFVEADEDSADLASYLPDAAGGFFVGYRISLPSTVRLRRYFSDGSPDTAYNTASGAVLPTLDEYGNLIRLLHVDLDGRVLFALGSTYPATNLLGIFRLNPDGTLDTSFECAYRTAPGRGLPSHAVFDVNNSLRILGGFDGLEQWVDGVPEYFDYAGSARFVPEGAPPPPPRECFWTDMVGVTEDCGGGAPQPSGPKLLYAIRSDDIHGGGIVFHLGPGGGEPDELPRALGDVVSASPDGAYVAVAPPSMEKGARVIYRTSDWAPDNKFSGFNAYGAGAVFSPDGQYVAVHYMYSSGNEYDTLRVYRVSDGATVFQITEEGAIANGWMRSAAFTLDSSRLFVGRSAWPYLSVYDVDTWTPTTVESWDQPWPATALAVVGSGGSMIAATQFSSPYIGFYDTSTLERVQYGLSGVTHYSHSVGGGSPDGALLAINMPWGVQMYDAATFSESVALSTGPPYSMQFSNDGSLFVVSTSSFPYLFLFDTRTWSEIEVTGASILKTHGRVCFLP